MDYQQTYIPHVYVELRMHAGVDEKGQPRFLMDPHHLHIWPRHAFLLIALPNPDCSFTMSLFAPNETFDELDAAGREGRRAFFMKQFPDAFALVNQEAFLDYRAFDLSGKLSNELKPLSQLSKTRAAR
jgi:kynurenine 3-monooxygenase